MSIVNGIDDDRLSQLTILRLAKDRDEWRDLARKLVPALGIALTGHPAVDPKYAPMSDYWHDVHDIWSKRVDEGTS